MRGGDRLSAVDRWPGIRQSDLNKILKALVEVGFYVSRIEIEPSGKIVLFSAGNADPQVNSWDVP